MDLLALGSTADGQLSLRETATGLAFQLDLAEDSAARLVRTYFQDRGVTGCSFSFRRPVYDVVWEWVEARTTPVRVVRSLELTEICLVSRECRAAYGAPYARLVAPGDAARAMRLRLAEQS